MMNDDADDADGDNRDDEKMGIRTVIVMTMMTVRSAHAGEYDARNPNNCE